MDSSTSRLCRVFAVKTQNIPNIKWYKDVKAIVTLDTKTANKDTNLVVEGCLKFYKNSASNYNVSSSICNDAARKMSGFAGK